MSHSARRDFSKTIALAAAGLWASPLKAAAPAALESAPAPRKSPSDAARPAPRTIKIGYTCITWGAFPRGAEASATLENAVKDIAALGYHSFETFPEILEDWDSRDALAPLIERYHLPLAAAYIRANLTDASIRKDELAKIARQAKVVKKYGGTFGVVGPNAVKRDAFDFKAEKASIVSALNDVGMAIQDAGLGVGVHPHTGTCMETRDEVYALMEAVDPKKMMFAPDVGQLQKGGADAVQVVKDFLPLVRHVHLKDWDGGAHFGGYCPLGQGKVDMKAVLDMMEGAGHPIGGMVELDPSKDAPVTPFDAAKTTKAYLQTLGYELKA